MMLGFDESAWTLIMDSLTVHRDSLHGDDSKREQIDELLKNLTGIGGTFVAGRIDGYFVPALLQGKKVMLELRIAPRQG